MDRAVVDSLVLEVYNDGIQPTMGSLGSPPGFRLSTRCPSMMRKMTSSGCTGYGAPPGLASRILCQGSLRLSSGRSEQVTAAHVRYKAGPAHLVDGEVLLG